MVAITEIFLQITLAAIFGGILGLEREYTKKEVGLRTYMLICVGSALFAIVGVNGPTIFADLPNASYDPIRIVQAVAIGMGFIGSGLIIIRKGQVEGLTTAAGAWVVSAIGIALGLRLYAIALFATMLCLFILAILRLFEKKFLRTK